MHPMPIFSQMHSQQTFDSYLENQNPTQKKSHNNEATSKIPYFTVLRLIENINGEMSFAILIIAGS